MSGRLALELAATTIRGVWATPWRTHPSRTFEVPWDATQPASGVAAIRAAAGADPDALWLAVSPDFLLAGRPSLPPAPDEAREQMVALEPDRFFPTTTDVQVGLAPGSDLALAVERAWLDEVTRVFSALAPVARVEASPWCLVATGLPDGNWALDASDPGRGAMTIAAGRLAGIRQDAPPTARPLPGLGSLPGSHRAAWGALLREDATLAGALMPPMARSQARRRIVRAVATAALGAAAGLSVLAASIDRWRQRTLDALESRATTLAPLAAPALAAQSAAQLTARERTLAHAALAERTDPTGVLAALGDRLPRDVVLTSVRANGREWQLDGTARDAAALVPLLDADRAFENVRSLAANTRFRDGRTTRESFSLAFRVRASP